ncbi:3'(2'),5'-bisphosphate nucleotidase [Aliidiomarina sedimenti]|uniref:3'(2'),5'-bisphosphate nucleotidase CysQ n=1 Tax=Aliidiomarina sedimenti TaxID=1933879 RepID=A0ABY0C002_9GAMM|nr:3'(2'),5'-bisphosphate nucleotidase CysQ [Aliidiomarina sedimenti]RUO30664.1 3'(2'),5'-bisphosphate nucleotidase [Aliidiomarina sedimenti]
MMTEMQTRVAQIARETGQLVLEHYRKQDFTVSDKADHSPVTSADIEASEFLTAALQAYTPDIPVLSEEAIVPWHERRSWQRYWLVDPIDGTQEFINGSGDFAISIALVEHYTPVLGAIYWPSEDILYHAVKGRGALRSKFRDESFSSEPISVRRLSDPRQDRLTLAISRRQSQDTVLSRMNPQRDIDTLMTGSCSLKSCLVAEGSADCFLRVGPTGEWDTGAAQVIVEEAGGTLVSEHFEPVTYNRTASLGNPNFMVLGDPRVDWVSVFPGLTV